MQRLHVQAALHFREGGGRPPSKSIRGASPLLGGRGEGVWRRWGTPPLPVRHHLGKSAGCPKAGAEPKLSSLRSSKSIRIFSKLHMVKSPCSNPYKTCRLLRLVRHFWQNGSGKYQKSIMFISKSWLRFTTLQNVKNALVLEYSGASRKVDKNTLWNLSFMDLFELISENGSKSIKKH